MKKAVVFLFLILSIGVVGCINCNYKEVGIVKDFKFQNGGYKSTDSITVELYDGQKFSYYSNSAVYVRKNSMLYYSDNCGYSTEVSP